MTFEQVTEAFLAAPPQVAQGILDFTVKTPMWMSEIYPIEPWAAQGPIEQQLISRAVMPQVERGFDKWRSVPNTTGCDPCSGPRCGYNWTQFGGTALERRTIALMDRDFRSPDYCIKEIQNTAQFQEVFDLIVKNLFRQTAFFKEQNIGFNALVTLAKKLVVDSGGFKPNLGNPYSYPTIGTTTLATLNLTMLTILYEWMRRDIECVPFMVNNGKPTFALISSDEILDAMFRNDPNVRADLRFSGEANNLVTRYNFMSTIRDMFLPVSILYPRRFNIDATSGNPVEVLPYANGIPAEIGVFTDLNPAYMLATHEEVLVHGKMPFKVKYKDTVQSLGNNTSFGPEYSFMNNWQWVNPQTVEDPARRSGFFMTNAEIAVAPMYSGGIFGILVTRPSQLLAAQFSPVPACPPEAPVCDNEIADTGCPCPLILSVTPHPITADTYFASLAVPVTVVADDPIDLGLDTEGYYRGTVVTSSADGKVVEFTLTAGTDIGDCDHFTTIFCDNTLGCSAQVVSYSSPVSGDATRIELILQHPIKADTAADTVTLYYGDGTTASATVVGTPDMLTNTWVVDIGGSAFTDDVGGIAYVCVPTATDATCPACGTGPTITQCE